jgi:hypothetical protein
MNCPACKTELVRTEGFPYGLGGSMVLVDCPVPSCQSSLVARVSHDDELVLLPLSEASRPAYVVARGSHRLTLLTVVGIIGFATVVALIAVRVLHPDGISNALLGRSFVEVGAITLSLSVVMLAGFVGLRSVRATRDAARLLEALPRIPGALEPVARGYR